MKRLPANPVVEWGKTMGRKAMNMLCKRIFLCLTALALGAALLARPGYYLYRDISFDWEERSEQAHIVRDYAAYRNISFGRYPWALIELFERNEETRDFVLNYPFREETEISLEDYSREEVPLFLQWDEAWGYDQYGGSFHAVTGCGPTCLAMAGYYLTGEETMNPRAIAQFSEKNGYYAKGYGSSWTLISEGGVKLGLDVVEIPLVKKRMTDNLDVGNLIICAMGPGDFTTTGHYILLTGAEEGGFRVNDPNSVKNSETLWTYDQIESQIRNLWVIRAAS